MSYLNALGEPVPDRDTVISPPDDVQKYADYMRKRYESQPIVAEDWPPRVGQDFFGRLALVEKQDSNKTSNSAWYQLRGQVDKVIDASGNKEIRVEDILKPVSDTTLSLRVVIDGPPGIGKTTLCHKLLNMWSTETLPHCQHDLVLYCPLRNRKIATATTLADLFECQRYEVPKVVNWFEEKNGKGLLIIFDGWDELCTQFKKFSIAAKIIHRDQLDQCSVLVTSRSYASSSLLKVSFIKHVQVIGFTQAEIPGVIIQTLQKNSQLAKELIEAYKKEESNVEWQDFNLMSYVELLGNVLTLGSFGVENDDNTVDWEKLIKNKDSKLAVKLINDLKIRGDVQSLCYIPLVCSMVILVYCKKGHLPATLSQLYENFILQAIRRQVEKQGTYDPYALKSLSSLPLQLLERIQKLCKLAYINLANTRMIFSLHQLQDQSLSEVDFFGLVTTFTEYDEKKYQFLHLSIQEFLAAWWIAKHENTENIFKKQFDNDHFRMCLRFVAGLTHLEHKSYEQHFNEQFDLQCKMSHDDDDALSKFFYRNPEIMNQHYNQYNITEHEEKFPILLLQLLYESQNVALCRLLAMSFNQSSLCLKRAMLSRFDWLCFSFFLSNSSITWNHLHFINLDQDESLIFTDGLANESLQTKCRRLEIGFYEPTNVLLLKFLQSSLVSNIQECNCHLGTGEYVLSLILLHFLKLPHVKILHLTCEAVDNSFNTDQCFEIEKCIQEKLTLEELKIVCHLGCGTDIITSVIKRVTKNKKITSFFLKLVLYYDLSPSPPIPDEVLQQLLKENHTLKALSLIIPDNLLQACPLFVEKNTPLTALEIRINMKGNYMLAESLLSHITELCGLFELIMSFSCSPVLLLFFPNLQSLISPETRAESAMVIHATLEIGSLKVHVTFNNGIATCKGFFDIYSISPPNKEIVQVVLKALGNNCIQFSNQLIFF